MAKSDAPNSSPSQAAEPPPAVAPGVKPGPSPGAEAEAAGEHGMAAPAPAAPSTVPTYLSAKSSRAAALARRLLAAGQLEEALETVEMALEMSRRILDAGCNRSGDGKEEGGEEECAPSNELHESLGPLYYLYGTTLLYAVEESDAMMAAGAPAVGGQQQPEEGGEPSFQPADIEVGCEEGGEVSFQECMLFLWRRKWVALDFHGLKFRQRLLLRLNPIFRSKVYQVLTHHPVFSH